MLTNKLLLFACVGFLICTTKNISGTRLSEEENISMSGYADGKGGRSVTNIEISGNPSLDAIKKVLEDGENRDEYLTAGFFGGGNKKEEKVDHKHGPHGDIGDAIKIDVSSIDAHVGDNIADAEGHVDEVPEKEFSYRKGGTGKELTDESDGLRDGGGVKVEFGSGASANRARPEDGRPKGESAKELSDKSDGLRVGGGVKAEFGNGASANRARPEDGLKGGSGKELSDKSDGLRVGGGVKAEFGSGANANRGMGGAGRKYRRTRVINAGLNLE